MQVAQSAADASKCEDGELPITALPLFDTFVLYAFADGRFIGVDKATDVVLLKESRLPGHESIFSTAHRTMCTISEVPRMHSPSVESFRELHLDAFVPALLTGLAKDWNALGRWDHNWFVSEHGSLEVDVTLSTGKRETQRLDKYLASLQVASDGEKASLPYLRGWYYERNAPSLIADLWTPGDFHDVAFKDWFRKLPKRHWPDFHWLFLGGASASTPLHVDPTLTHAWLTQLYGRKRFVLFPPCDLPNLLKESNGVQKGGLCSLEEARARGVKGLDIVLHPGDTLFVPAFWAHHVECIDHSTSLTWNFLPEKFFPIVRAAFLANAARPTVAPNAEVARGEGDKENSKSNIKPNAAEASDAKPNVTSPKSSSRAQPKLECTMPNSNPSTIKVQSSRPGMVTRCFAWCS